MEWDATADDPGPAARVAFGITVGAVVLGVTMMLGAAEDPPGAGPPQPSAPPGAGGAALATPPGGGSTPALPSATPTWVSIPAVGVDAPLVAVGLDAEGWVAAPPPGEERLAGWYEGAVTPGERGTAVLVGHVDAAAGPAVFYDLGALLPGDTVEVIREDGRAVEFTVYETAVFDKDRFPPRVYRDTERAELRVITCGGAYQEGAGYEANVVVFARLSGIR
ncbi:class F sortase [Streptomyces sp. 6N223]|uniref:class F sortase n=1 Tax=Streptomyces sp. 6N223 TaxID=3457412 RepID=UPI003FD12F08